MSLRVGTEQVKLFASIDTGAEYCLFQRGFAEALLIEPEPSDYREFSTAAGKFALSSMN